MDVALTTIALAVIFWLLGVAIAAALWSVVRRRRG